jgi:hypothetical protein
MEGEETKIRDMIILDEDRKKKVTIRKESFVIKALFPKDYKDIANRLAMDYQGMSVNAYSVSARNQFERDAYVDQGILESPSWWANAEECPEVETVESLYNEILKWTNDFQEKLKKNKFAKRDKKG